MVNALFLVDGALGEHICLALQVSVLVQHFQGTQQAVGAVLLKCPFISGAVEKSPFCGKTVIGRVQLFLKLCNLCIGTTV